MRVQLCHVSAIKTPLISNQQRRAAILGQFNVKSFLNHAQTAHLDLKVQERSVNLANLRRTSSTCPARPLSG